VGVQLRPGGWGLPSSSEDARGQEESFAGELDSFMACD